MQILLDIMVTIYFKIYGQVDIDIDLKDQDDYIPKNSPQEIATIKLDSITMQIIDVII